MNIIQMEDIKLNEHELKVETYGDHMDIIKTEKPLSSLDEFFSRHVDKCIPARISRNKYVTEALFIKHPQLFHAPTFGENPSLSIEYLESKANELDYEWMSYTPHIEFLLRRPEKIVWSAAASNLFMPVSLLLEHENELGLGICDNSNMTEEYFSSRIARGLPVDGCRLSANKAISAKWLIDNNLLNWAWVGYNVGIDQQFFRDNYSKIRFESYAYNKNADFELVDRHFSESPDHLNNMYDACFNPSVPDWFIKKWRKDIDVRALCSNSNITLDYLINTVGDLHLSALSYNSSVPISWHEKHLDVIDWDSLCYKASTMV